MGRGATATRAPTRPARARRSRRGARPAPEPFEGVLWHGTDTPGALLDGPVRCGGNSSEDDEPRLGLYLTADRGEAFNYGHTPVAMRVSFRRALHVTLPTPETPRDPADEVLGAVGIDDDSGRPPGQLLAELGYDGVLIDYSDGSRWVVPLSGDVVAVHGQPDIRLQEATERLGQRSDGAALRGAGTRNAARRRSVHPERRLARMASTLACRRAGRLSVARACPLRRRPASRKDVASD
jgi:hypothetical protein